MYRFFLLASVLVVVEALIAFDCHGSKLNMTSISLVTTPECIATKKNITIEEIRIALSQTSIQYETTYMRCNVETLNLIGRCGKSIDTFADKSLFSEIISVTRDECSNMVRTKTYRASTSNGKVDFKLTGGLTKESYTTRGSFSDGSCNPGTDLTRNGITYTRPIVNTEYSITTSSGTALVDVESDTIKFPGGAVCRYSDENCFSADLGYLFWDKPRPKCNDQKEKSLIYSGIANLVTVVDETTQKFVQVTHDGYDFQILLSERTEYICGYRSYHTEHPNLYVTILNIDNPFLDLERRVTPLDVNLLNYVNSKIVYSVRHINQEVDRLFSVFQRDRCESHNRITENMMTLAILSPIEFAYMYGGQGYTAVRRGEVIYLARCSPVVVEINMEESRCFNELPVSYENRTMFMSPRNRVLVPVGKPVDCLPDLMPKFLLGDMWYIKTEHGLMKTISPSTISQEPLSYKFEVMGDLASGGLYTSELIQKYQEALVSPIVSDIITYRLKDSIQGGSTLPEGYSFVSGFKPVDFSTIQSRVSTWWDHFTGRATTLGSWMGFVLLIFGFWKMVIYGVGCFFNFRAINQELNWLIAIPLCLFESLTSLFLHGKLLENRKRTRTMVVERDTQIPLV
uniref:Glycoprotein n=1 Tax=Gordis virus TaxID=2800918 RepID=A0A894KF40_9MONO|nr:MAG: glycoprotein [Gordis virus]